MSGTVGRPDWGAGIADLDRRVGNLERRTTPAPAAPAGAASPARLMAEGAVSVGTDSVYQTIELLPLDGSDPNVRWGDGLNFVITTGPYSLTTGRVMEPTFWYPSYSSGSLSFAVNFAVWNPAVTEFYRVMYYSGTIAGGSAGAWTPLSGAAPTTLHSIGGDLSIGSNNIVTAAGGIYLASAWFGFGVTPTP